MNEVLENLDFEDAILLTAPPGWGKTYKLLDAIKSSQRQVLFLFPLRALCDEVYLSALNKKISVVNLRGKEDYELLNSEQVSLVVATPEVVRDFGNNFINFTVILDEFHLFYYWGDTFRERLNELYFEVTSFGVPIIFLSATFSEELKRRLETELSLNYKNIYHLNFGNQKLKNYPKQTFFYPNYYQSWMRDDIFFSKKMGTSIVFCQYRNQVKEMSKKLREMDFKVLDCVGGEAAEFIQKLNCTTKVDFIVATSVVSHGVNLPNIEKIYFTYKVENLDFYLQMLGRGGRDGGRFECHILNSNFFSKYKLLKGFAEIFIKRLRNKVNSLLYYTYAH